MNTQHFCYKCMVMPSLNPAQRTTITDFVSTIRRKGLSPLVPSSITWWENLACQFKFKVEQQFIHEKMLIYIKSTQALQLHLMFMWNMTPNTSFYVFLASLEVSVTAGEEAGLTFWDVLNEDGSKMKKKSLQRQSVKCFIFVVNKQQSTTNKKPLYKLLERGLTGNRFPKEDFLSGLQRSISPAFVMQEEKLLVKEIPS